MNELKFKIDVYEGPLALLLKLIEKNKLDIYDIPISSLTDQYIEAIQDMANDDMDSMSEFIVMAATLLEIKSKLLLPKDEIEEEEEDSRDDLIRRLIEYKRFKEVSEILAEKEFLEGDFVHRMPDQEILSKIRKDVSLDVDEILLGADIDMLFSAFEEVLKRKEDKTDKIRSNFNAVKKATFNLNDKINYLSDLIKLKKRFSFSNIFKYDSPKSEKIVTFLAVLELIKMKKILVKQDLSFQEITIEAI